MNKRGLTIAIVVLAMFQGCSATRLGYNNIDWLATRQADRYLDLDRTQRDALRSVLRDEVEWHRSHELPHYHRILAEFQARYEPGLVADDIDWLIEVAQARYLAVAERLIPDIADLCAGLSPVQITHLEKRLLEDLDEQRREHAERVRRYQAGEVDALRAESAKATVRRIEGWSGRLSREQRQRMEVIFPWSPPSEESSTVLRREDRIAVFIATLQEGADAREVEALLHAWWVAPASQPPEDAESSGQREAFRAAFLLADSILERQQRDRILRRVAGYQRDASALAGQAP